MLAVLPVRKGHIKHDNVRNSPGLRKVNLKDTDLIFHTEVRGAHIPNNIEPRRTPEGEEGQNGENVVDVVSKKGHLNTGQDTVTTDVTGMCMRADVTQRCSCSRMCVT